MAEPYQSCEESSFADGMHLVDWGVVWRIFYDIARLTNYLDPGYQSSVNLGGGVRSLEFDFEGAAIDARAAANEATIDISLKGQLENDWKAADLRNRMRAELGRLDALNTRFRALLAENSRSNERALAATVGNWERAITLAEWTRDLSVIVLGVGGTVLTGGATGGLLPGMVVGGASSGLGAVAKAQDQGLSFTSETVGKVALNASIDFTVGLVSFGMDKTLKAGKIVKQAVVIVVNTTGGTLSSLAMPAPDAGSFGEQVGTAYVDSVVDGALEKAVEAKFGKLARYAIGKAIVPHMTALSKVTPKAKGKLVGDTANKLVAKGGRKVLNAGTATAMNKIAGTQKPKKGVDPRMPIHSGAAAGAARLTAIFP